MHETYDDVETYEDEDTDTLQASEIVEALRAVLSGEDGGDALIETLDAAGARDARLLCDSDYLTGDDGVTFRLADGRDVLIRIQIQ